MAYAWRPPKAQRLVDLMRQHGLELDGTTDPAVARLLMAAMARRHRESGTEHP